MITGAKYSMLYPPLVARIYDEEARKGAKDCEKAVKTRLHQMFGAYVQGNAHKKAAALLGDFPVGGAVPHNLTNALLSLHASTKERLPHYGNFYAFLSQHVQKIETIMDLGCGFNPFSLPYLPEIKTWHAYDIDTRTRDLLNQFFALQNLPQTAACADLVTETPWEKADLALLCKLIPVLEAQLPGRGFGLARQLDAKFLVITYPTKSLGGREKGMGKNYAAQFDKAYADGALGGFRLLASETIGNELVYVLERSSV